MKKLSDDFMVQIQGGGCGAAEAAFAVSASSFGLYMVLLGPVGWGAALAAGAAGMAMVAICEQY